MVTLTDIIKAAKSVHWNNEDLYHLLVYLSERNVFFGHTVIKFLYEACL